MRCFTWPGYMVLMSRSVRDALRMVRAASSGDELEVSSAKLAGPVVLKFFFLLHQPIPRLCMLNSEPAERRLLAGAATAQTGLLTPVISMLTFDQR